MLDSTAGANAANGWNPDFETPSLFGLNQPGGLLGTKAKSAFSGISGLDNNVNDPNSPAFRANQQLLGQNGAAGGAGGYGAGGVGGGDMGNGLKMSDINGFNLRILGYDKDGKPVYEKFLASSEDGANGSNKESGANGNGAEGSNSEFGNVYTGGFYNADGSPFVQTGKKGKIDVYDNKGNLISKDGGVTFLKGKIVPGKAANSGADRESRLAFLKGNPIGQQWEDQQLIREHEQNTRVLRTAYEREQQRQLVLMGEMKGKITVEREE